MTLWQFISKQKFQQFLYQMEHQTYQLKFFHG